MKFVLYGMPCSGKTTLLNALSKQLFVVKGSSWLQEQTQGSFDSLLDLQKLYWRGAYLDYLKELPHEHLISDGHYAFADDVVFTSEDGDCYDIFLYLYCQPEVLFERLSHSSKNHKFAHLSVDELDAWQQREVRELREQCHQRNKDFYVIPDSNLSVLEVQSFIKAIIDDDFSSFKLAEIIVAKIKETYPQTEKLVLIDGDKTFINEDTLSVCAPGFKTTIFDGDFYTGYQSYCFEQQVQGLELDYKRLEQCTLNEKILLCLHCEEARDHTKLEELEDKGVIIISSGINNLWSQLVQRWNLSTVFASPFISADTKYYVAKLLRAEGYHITAYGDSQNDWYLLHEADEGYVYIGSRVSRSLRNSDISDLKFLMTNHVMVLNQCAADSELLRDIELCKSSSGVTGAKLAQAHYNLGQKMGAYLKQVLPNKNIPVLVLERGGRFFGDGVYLSFGGKFYPFNPKHDKLPELKSNFILIVDSVINTGNSLLDLIKQLKHANPDLQVALVTNVIQRDALAKFKLYPLFAIRVSDNKFVGTRQRKQVGNSGPDTADRLFNLIDD